MEGRGMLSCISQWSATIQPEPSESFNIRDVDKQSEFTTENT